MRRVKFLAVISCILLASSCNILDFLNDDVPPPGTPDDSKIVFNLAGNIDNQTTEWKFSNITNVTIPDQKIDSIILSVPLRSSKISPYAEAILLDANSENFINPSQVRTTFRYTIEHKRSRNLKGYFYPGNYGLKVGVRSSGGVNYTKISGNPTLTIYLSK